MIAAPVIDLSTIPDAQRPLVAALMETITALQEITRRQQHLIAEMNHALHGKRSEKLTEDERQLAFEDLSIALAEVEVQKEDLATKTGDKTVTKPASKRTIGNLPAALPRIEEVIEPDSLVCPCGCGLMHKIGEDRSERLDIVPAQLRVIVTVRPKYACRTCTDGVTQAPAPSHLIMGGLPTEATIAHVLVSKYADHLPLYRQSQILARAGLDLHRAVLADWVGKSAFHLKPVVDRLAEHLKRSGKLFMDETRAPVLDPGARKTKTGYFWALARDDRPWGGTSPPGVVFTYAPGRGGQHADRILQGFGGILQVDGYAGYNRLIAADRIGPDIQLAYCWAHARRKLIEITRAGPAPIADEGVDLIRDLYAIEAEIRGSDPATRLVIRQDRSALILARIDEWLAHHRARASAKSPLGEALAYIAKYRDGLGRFLTDGRIEIDNNLVENAIRPTAIGKKNWLFIGDAEAGQRLLDGSLVATFRLLHGVGDGAFDAE
jgi:transposase